jgi:urease accessory protein
MSPLVLAHTGQPIHNLWDGLIHPLTGPDHLLAMAAIGILAALATSRRTAWLTPIGFVGGMIAGGAMGMLGLDLPAVDTFIALTVVTLGVLTITATTGDRVWLPLLAVAFGFTHGVSHGAEAPMAASPVAYIGGFVLMTALLHGAGAATGWSFRRIPVLRIAAGTMISGAGVALLLTV